MTFEKAAQSGTFVQLSTFAIYDVTKAPYNATGGADDTAAIQAAINAAGAAGGGYVLTPPIAGAATTYTFGTLTMAAHVIMGGPQGIPPGLNAYASPGPVRWKLKNGTNSAMFNMSGAAPGDLAWQDVVVDGNSANNTSGGKGLFHFDTAATGGGAVRFTRVTIIRPAGDAVFAGPIAAWAAFHCERLVADGGGSPGIGLNYQSSDGFFDHCSFAAFDQGFYVRSAANRFYGGDVFGNRIGGTIDGAASPFNGLQLFDGFSFDHNRQNGLVISGEQTEVRGCRFTQNGTQTDRTYSHILVTTHDSTVAPIGVHLTGNTFDDANDTTGLARTGLGGTTQNRSKYDVEFSAAFITAGGTVTEVGYSTIPARVSNLGHTNDFTRLLRPGDAIYTDNGPLILTLASDQTFSPGAAVLYTCPFDVVSPRQLGTITLDFAGTTGVNYDVGIYKVSTDGATYTLKSSKGATVFPGGNKTLVGFPQFVATPGRYVFAIGMSATGGFRALGATNSEGIYMGALTFAASVPLPATLTQSSGSACGSVIAGTIGF